MHHILDNDVAVWDALYQLGLDRGQDDLTKISDNDWQQH
jgi:hypothetical protein